MKSNKHNRAGNRQDFFETDGKVDPEVDDIYLAQKKYAKSPRGKRASKRARDKYDSKDPDRRRKQKRDYMRRRREKDPDAWRY